MAALIKSIANEVNVPGLDAALSKFMGGVDGPAASACVERVEQTQAVQRVAPVGRDAQLEAARAVGLNYMQVIGLVILPQALRVIIPPLISQYLNLTKNSSLALLIGYQDLFGVAKIAINQAGRVVPIFAMTMATYLTMSLITSVVLNIYNRRIQFVER